MRAVRLPAHEKLSHYLSIPNPTTSRVYVAGPMTGRFQYNAEVFAAAAAQLTAEGHEVVTPFECNSIVWRRHFGRDFDPTIDRCDYGDPILAEMLVEDLRALAAADAVAVLPEWEKSKGARAEVLYASMLGKRVVSAIGGADVSTEVITTIVRDDSVALEADSLVHGDRHADYGHPVEDYTRVGRIWAAILSGHLGIPMGDLDPRICALMMVGIKISREAQKSKRDNRVDMAGYSEVMEMIAQRQRDQLDSATLF
jgi:hypothetical protein